VHPSVNNGAENSLMSSVASSSVLFFNLTSLALFPSLLHPLTRLFPARRCLKSYDDFGQKYKPANRVLICNPWRAKTVDQRKNQKSGWKIWFNPRPVRPLVPSRSVRPSTKGPKDRRPKDLSLSGKAKAKLVLGPRQLAKGKWKRRKLVGENMQLSDRR